MNNLNNNPQGFEDLGLSVIDIIEILKRNFWIPLLTIFLLTSVGLVYHEYIVEDPVEYRERRAETTFVNPTPDTRDDMRMIINFNRTHQLASLRLREAGFNISEGDLRSGIGLVNISNNNNTVHLHLRASPEEYRQAGISRSRLRIEQVDEILEIFIDVILEMATERSENNTYLWPSIQRMQVSLPDGVGNGRIISVSNSPTSTIVDTPTSWPLYFFIIAGLALGAFGAVTKELMGDKVYDFETIEKLHNTKIIGTLPKYKG